MIFEETPLRGAFAIAIEPIEDERGFFARSFCAREMQAHGLCSQVSQCDVSFNRRRGTVRGMHLQRPPHAEVKLVCCTAGRIHDVIVDLRVGSPTFARHFAIELTARNRRALYVPRGFAHGFQSLEDDTEVFYQMSQAHAPHAAAGFRWNDPAFGIEWPLDVSVISERDRSFPDFQPDRLLGETPP
jgi:dTDP-4-dehydrorhamnose 3,5-epimerase